MNIVISTLGQPERKSKRTKDVATTFYQLARLAAGLNQTKMENEKLTQFNMIQQAQLQSSALALAQMKAELDMKMKMLEGREAMAAMPSLPPEYGAPGGQPYLQGPNGELMLPEGMPMEQGPMEQGMPFAQGNMAQGGMPPQGMPQGGAPEFMPY